MNSHEEQELREALEKADFSQLISQDVYEKLIPKFYPISFAKGEKVIQKGTSAGAFLILAKGRLEVLIQNEKGEDIKVKSLGPGNYVGEMALITGDVRNATVVARNFVKAFILGRSAFEHLLTEVPAIRDFFSEVSERRRKDIEKKQNVGKVKTQKPCLQGASSDAPCDKPEI